MRARPFRLARGALATLALTALALSAASACSAILDSGNLDRNRCDAPADCPGAQTCDLGTHLCTGESDATTRDGGAEAGPAPDGGGGLPVSDWQYQFSTDTTLTLGGVALDRLGNVLVVGTGGSEVEGENNDGGASQGIYTSSYPEAFFSGFSGDGKNYRFNDKIAADDGGASVPLALFAADLVDAGSPPDPTNSPLLVATLVPGDPTQLVLDAYHYDATGVAQKLPSAKVRKTITLGTASAPDGGMSAGDASFGGPRDAGAAYVSAISLNAALRAPSGALYIAGSFAGAITVDTTTYTSLLDTAGAPTNDGFVMRFDPSGGPTQTWVFATHDDDTVSSLCDVNGDLGIGGVFTDTGAGGDPLLFQGAPTGIVGAGKGDGFYAVMSASMGTLGLVGSIGSPMQDAVRAVAYEPSSNQLLVGGRAEMGLAIGDQEFDDGSENEFAFLAAFNAATGHAAWANLYPTGSLNGPGNADTVISHLSVLPGSGDILVGGTFLGVLDIGGAPRLTSTPRSGFLAHLAADGGARWSAVLGDSIHDVLLDADGGVLVTGSFTQPLRLAGGASFAPGGSNDAGAIFLAHFPFP